MCISLLCLVANVALTAVANVALTSLTAVQVSSHVAHELLSAYKRKHRKLPTLGDDVTDEEGSQDDNSDASDGAVSD